MSKKSGKIAALIARCQGQPIAAHYLGYFECFNAGLYYEAHDVLEELWLPDRQGPNGDYYKGLIQLAGAFVHLRKERLRPAAALFKLALANLNRYPERHEHLEIARVRGLIGEWLQRLETGDYRDNPLHTTPAPRLALVQADPTE